MRKVLTPWLGPVVIYSGHQHLRVDSEADCAIHVEDEKPAELKNTFQTVMKSLELRSGSLEQAHC